MSDTDPDAARTTKPTSLALPDKRVSRHIPPSAKHNIADIQSVMTKAFDVLLRNPRDSGS